MRAEALAMLARAQRLGVNVENRGGRLWAGPSDWLTDDLRAELRRFKDELLLALAAGAGMPVADRIDGGDVEKRDVAPTVGVGLGDEQLGLHQGNGVRVADGERLAPGCENAEGLEGVAVEQFLDRIPCGHAPIVASGRTESQRDASCRTEPHGDAPIPYRPPELWDAADRAVIEALEGLRHVRRPGSESPATRGGSTPGVPDGWTRGSWARRLAYLADVCEATRPDLANEYRRRAGRSSAPAESEDSP